VVLVGQWSYSLYLWHWAVMVCAAAALPGGLAALTGEGRPGFPLPVFLPALLAASFALACLSYYFVERPTQRLRHRFGALTPGSGAAAARSGGLAPYGICQRPENTVDMALLGDQRG
jgi:peptidoglycan/LPS O-acetylase OafA/YrhL